MPGCQRFLASTTTPTAPAPAQTTLCITRRLRTARANTLLPPAAGRSSQSAKALPSPQPPRPPTPLASLPCHPTVLLDAACAACCIVLLGTAAARRWSSSSSSSPSSQPSYVLYGARGANLADASAQPSATAVAAPQHQECVAASTLALSPGAAVQPLAAPWGLGLEAQAVAACTLLLSLSNLAYKVSRQGRSSAPGLPAAVSLEAAAKLAKLEALTERQLADFATAARQIDKLQVRTRISAGDLRRPLAKLQATSVDQSALLSRLATEQEVLRGQLRDTQTLLAALQGLSAKQFQVTVEAIKQLRARQASSG